MSPVWRNRSFQGFLSAAGLIDIKKGRANRILMDLRFRMCLATPLCTPSLQSISLLAIFFVSWCLCGECAKPYSPPRHEDTKIRKGSLVGGLFEPHLGLVAQSS